MSSNDYPNIRRQADGWPEGVTDDQKTKLTLAAEATLRMYGPQPVWMVGEQLRRPQFGLQDAFGALGDYNCAVVERACRAANARSVFALTPGVMFEEVVGRRTSARREMLSALVLAATAGRGHEDDAVFVGLLAKHAETWAGSLPKDEADRQYWERRQAHVRILKEAAVALASIPIGDWT